MRGIHPLGRSLPATRSASCRLALPGWSSTWIGVVLALVLAVAGAPGLAAVAPGDAVRGQLLYDETPGGVTCASCHGEATLGLLRLRFGVDPGVTRAAIVAGKGGMNQPNLLALTDQDLSDIAAYIADPAAGAAVDPVIEPGSAVSFSRATLGGPAVERVVTVINPGRSRLPLAPLVVTGTGFELASGCPPALDPQARCAAVLRFRAPVAGDRTGAVSGSYGDRGTPWSLALSGQGVDRPIGILRWRDPAALATFTESVAGRTTLLARTWLDNVGAHPVTVQRVALDGAAGGDFSASGACTTPGSVLPAGAGCEVEVRFAPVAVGRRVAALTVSSDGNDPPDVSLNAVGIAPGPALALEPRSLTVATSGRVELANPGQSALQVVALEVSDPAFRASGGTCGPLPFVVAPLATCSLEIGRVAGSRLDATGALTVRSGTPGLTAVVSLRATGVDTTGGAVTLGNIGAGSLTVGPGSIASLLGLALAGFALRRPSGAPARSDGATGRRPQKRPDTARVATGDRRGIERR